MIRFMMETLNSQLYTHESEVHGMNLISNVTEEYSLYFYVTA